MEHDQEGEALDFRHMMRMMHELGETVEAGLISVGIDPDVAHHFACLRFHPLHSWGLAHVLSHGKPRLAIVRQTSDGTAAFVMALLSAAADDIKGINGIEIDADGCLPMSAFVIAPTQH